MGQRELRNKKMNTNIKSMLSQLLMILLLLPLTLYAQSGDEEELLMPEQAFPAKITAVDGESISLQWNVADKYYLYRSKFRFTEENDNIELGDPETPPGKVKKDEFFGEVEIYRGTVDVKVPYTITGKAPASFTLTAISQGCADLGVCYPPHKQNLEIKLPIAQASTISVPNPIAALSNLGKSLGITQSSDDEFLEPDQAFQLVVTTNENNEIKLDFTAADKYYLYRDKIKANVVDHPENIKLGALELPKGKVKQDEYFGDVSVFYGRVVGNVPVTNTNKEPRPFKLQVQYQGCADAGLCYPPIKKTFELTALPTAAAATVETGKPSAENTSVSAPVEASQSAPAVSAPPATSADEPVTEQDQLAAFLLENPLWLSALLFFGLGLLRVIAFLEDFLEYAARTVRVTHVDVGTRQVELGADLIGTVEQAFTGILFVLACGEVVQVELQAVREFSEIFLAGLVIDIQRLPATGGFGTGFVQSGQVHVKVNTRVGGAGGGAGLVERIIRHHLGAHERDLLPLRIILVDQVTERLGMGVE